MYVRHGTDEEQRAVLLQRWYRRQLRELIQPLLRKWQAALNVEVSRCCIRKMKTKWGGCNPGARRIWVNLELAKKPVECLEYVLVHELVHLIERHHNDRFTAIMDRRLPSWRMNKQELNRAPLAHEDWSY